MLVLLFCCPAIHPFTFVMGCCSVFNLLDKLNNMIDMKVFNHFLIGWTSAILGRSTREKRLVTLIDVNIRSNR